MQPPKPALGPIGELMADPDITEIMINGPEQVYVERAGLMELSDVRFDNEDDLRRLIEVLLRPTGRAVSSATPYADFRLADGSRGHVVIPPIALNGPVVTIRKFTKTLTGVGDLIAAGTLSRQMAQLLGAAVAARRTLSSPAPPARARRRRCRSSAGTFRKASGLSPSRTLPS